MHNKDLSKLVGMTEAVALAYLRKEGIAHRIVKRDTQSVGLDKSLDMNRVSLNIRNGKVEKFIYG